MNWFTRVLAFVFPAASFAYVQQSIEVYGPPVPMEIRVKNSVAALMKASFISEEGNKDVSYIDTEGYLTGGIGHKLSTLEKVRYPKGTKIPASVIETWWQEDSKKALDAAMTQAKELNKVSMDSLDFILALTHVNFQLGIYWRTKFPSTWESLKKGQWQTTISKLERSLWKQQTPVRVANFISAIREEYA